MRGLAILETAYLPRSLTRGVLSIGKFAELFQLKGMVRGMKPTALRMQIEPASHRLPQSIVLRDGAISSFNKTPQSAQ